MSDVGHSNISIPKIMKFLLNSLREHETDMDRIVDQLNGVKIDISVRIEKSALNSKRIESNIVCVEDKIALAKQMLANRENVT